MRAYWVLVIFATAAPAAVLDRAAVIVGTDAITESELLEEIRITAFLNQEPVDLSPASRRAAADRLVDQTLIRREMKIGRFDPPKPAEADVMMRQFRQEHYPGVAPFERGLEKYGITQAELKDHLLRQLAALRFTDLRFRAGLPAADATVANREALPRSVPPERTPGRGGAERTEPEADSGASADPAATLDQRMDAWLKRTRENTRIEYKAEALR